MKLEIFCLHSFVLAYRNSISDDYLEIELNEVKFWSTGLWG